MERANSTTEMKSSRSRSRGDGTNRRKERTLRGKRRKRVCYWDMTPEQAIRIGLPLERAQAQIPSTRGTTVDSNSCKVYCGLQNSPVTPSEDELRQFFNVTMIAAQGAERRPGDSVVGVYLNPERRYAFIQFRTPEEATQALDLDGINFRGQRLRLGSATHAGAGNTAAPRSTNIRPLNVQRLGIVSTQVPDGPYKLYIGGLPFALTEDQVKELLSTYGALKGFFLFRDMSTNVSRGYAFAEYRDHSVTNAAIKGLNGLQVGDKRIIVKIHDAGVGKRINPTEIVQDLGLGRMNALAPTEVVCFLQMVTESDLIDESEYQGIMDDVREEASKYGQVVDIVIPRPVVGRRVPGVGKVFVQMVTIEACQKVKNALEGRQFLGRTVLATFFNKEKFIQRQL